MFRKIYLRRLELPLWPGALKQLTRLATQYRSNYATVGAYHDDDRPLPRRDQVVLAAGHCHKPADYRNIADPSTVAGVFRHQTSYSI